MYVSLNPQHFSWYYWLKKKRNGFAIKKPLYPKTTTQLLPKKLLTEKKTIVKSIHSLLYSKSKNIWYSSKVQSMVLVHSSHSYNYYLRFLYLNFNFFSTDDISTHILYITCQFSLYIPVSPFRKSLDESVFSFIHKTCSVMFILKSSVLMWQIIGPFLYSIICKHFLNP